MRQAIVRIPLKYALGETVSLVFQKIESAKLVGLVGPSQGTFQSIWRIVFKDKKWALENMSHLSGIANAEVLSRSGDEFVLYMERRLAEYEPLSRIRHLMPWEVNGEDVRITILGTDEEIERWMKELQEKKIPFVVDSLGSASFVPQSPLSELTEKQKEVLLTAYREGYYQIPRKTSLKEMAESLNTDESTVAEHLRKAESVLMERIVTEAHLFVGDRAS